MKHFLVAVLCVAIPITAVANDGSYKVSYDGGSISEAKAGTSAKLAGGAANPASDGAQGRQSNSTT